MKISNQVPCLNIHKALLDEKYVKILFTLDQSSIAEKSRERMHKYVVEYLDNYQKDTYLSMTRTLIIGLNKKEYVKYEVKLLIDSWFKFCYDKYISVNFFVGVYLAELFNRGVYTGEFLFQIENYRRENKLKFYQHTTKDIEEFLSILAGIYFNYINTFIQGKNIIPLKFIKESFFKLVENSVKEAKLKVPVEHEKWLAEFKNDVYQKNTKGIGEMIDEQGVLDNIKDNICTNQKFNAYSTNSSHHMSKVYTDTVEVKEDFTPILKNFTKGLTTGCTSQALLMDIDKDYTVKKLTEVIDVFEERNREEFQSYIDFLKGTLKFVEQQKNAKHITFKSLAKALNLTENEARLFAGSKGIGGNTYKNNFLEWIDLDDIPKI